MLEPAHPPADIMRIMAEPLSEIPAGVPTVSTRGSDFWLLEGILLGRTRPQAVHGEIDDAVDAVTKIKVLTGGARHPLIFDARNVGWLQIKAREHIHRHAAELFTRAAVIVRPNTLRVFSRALMGVARIEIPVEMFLDEQRAWDFANRPEAA
jgi:hypothetical protein